MTPIRFADLMKRDVYIGHVIKHAVVALTMAFRELSRLM
jgi:hypothetical protein